jgi:hypothetical protein
MRRLAILAMTMTAGFLAACGPGIEARFADPSAVGPKGAKPTLGIVSAIGDSIGVQTVGITVFGNERQSASIAAWRLDDHVVRTVSARLGAAATAKPIVMPAGAFDAYHNPPGALSGALDAHLSGDERVVKALEPAARQHPADGYIVVLKSRTPYASTNVQVAGLGVAQGPQIIGPNRHLHALIEIRYYDKTLALKNIKLAKNSEPHNPFMPNPIHGPSTTAETGWPATAGELAADARVQAAMRAVLDQALATTLPEVISLGRAGGG